MAIFDKSTEMIRIAQDAKTRLINETADEAMRLYRESNAMFLVLVDASKPKRKRR